MLLSQGHFSFFQAAEKYPSAVPHSFKESSDEVRPHLGKCTF
jgi:hypothetical protein